MKNLLCYILLASGLLSSSHAFSATDKAPSVLGQYIQSPHKVGEARLKVLFWDIYDAQLFSSNGRLDRQQAFALTLTYLRDFDGEDIASRSVDEMRDQGVNDEVQLAAWFERMRTIFPDVKQGDTITGIQTAQGQAVFYLNEQILGQIDDAAFSQHFFDIWLAENTSEPSMRKKLLGISE